MSDDLRHARQPNTRITGICLDCGPLEDVGGLTMPAGARRFLSETGHCTTCGSAATMMPNAVRELKRRLHHKKMAEVATKRAHRGKANRRDR